MDDSKVFQVHCRNLSWIESKVLKVEVVYTSLLLSDNIWLCALDRQLCCKAGDGGDGGDGGGER